MTPQCRRYAPRPAPSAPPTSCNVCHAPLPPSHGRPRLVCSSACRRARDHRERKIRRRLAYIAAWQAECDAGRCTRDTARLAIRRIRDDIRRLQAPAAGHDADDRSRTPAA
jgi:hypothetical protein